MPVMLIGATEAGGNVLMDKIIPAEHVLIAGRKRERFSYFGWPTVARLEDDTLVVAASGPRAEHVCPFGKTALVFSPDRGRTWSEPAVIQDSMIDDRDAGIVCVGGRRLLVSWFRSDTRMYASEAWIPEQERAAWKEVFASWTDETVRSLLGSWIMLSEDGGRTWGEPLRVPVSAPHGPIVLKSGRLLYVGKPYGTWDDMNEAMIAAAVSDDSGRSWRIIGKIPRLPGTAPANYHEPHAVELADGRIIAAIRVENHGSSDLAAVNVPSFSMVQTESTDGGANWTTPRPLGFHGSPPHLLRHSSGILVLSYGYRRPPFGERIAFSSDHGATWDHDWILRDDAPDGDLGYPSTVEMSDGSLFTAYYQKAAAGEKCSLLGSRWRMPREILALAGKGGGA